MAAHVPDHVDRAERGRRDLVRARPALFLFEVEWTAMVGDAILDRGRQIPVGEQQARFLVIPAERGSCFGSSSERSPWLRAESNARTGTS